MADVRFDHVYKRYGEATSNVISDLNLHVRDHEFLVLVGPSGCGKSTALRMIAGLEEITDGDLFIGDRRVNDLDPKDRDIAMVFQNYALYPHMTVAENIGFALRMRKVPKQEARRRIEETARIIGLLDHLDRKPKQLSGGQRQRVAMGRAIVRQPQVFLFDEPLSNLDAKLRAATRIEIKKLHAELGVTSLFVTHDQVEAMTLAERMIVMNAGRMEQIGTPEEVYARPATTFVASFIGSPPMNLLHGVADGASFRVGGQTLPLPRPAPRSGPLVLGVRPEHVQWATRGEGSWELQVDVLEMLGAERLIYCRLADSLFTVRIDGMLAAPAPGDRVPLMVTAERLHWYDAGTLARVTQ